MLWTNPDWDGTVATTFDPQTITLSQSLTNFDYIKIYYKLQYHNLNTNKYANVIYPVAEFTDNTEYGAYTRKCFFAHRASSTIELRRVYYVSNTKIGFEHSFVYHSNTVDNGGNIPIKIIGVK